MKHHRTRLAIGLAVLLAGSEAIAAGLFDRSVTAVRDAIVARGLDADEILVPFELNAEIVSWLDERTVPGMTQDAQVQLFLRELQSAAGRAMTYDRGYTGTAEEVFASKRFNCLGLSNLFVGLARSIGLDAYYLRVDRMQRYGQEGSFVVASSHITAAYGPLSHRVVLEFGFEEGEPYATGARLTDLQAVSLFYTNRGTELLRKGRHKEAEEQLRIALELDPRSPDAWVNLGVVRRRMGDLKGAEAAYNRALDHDPQLISAYYNLSVLYRLQGDRDEARKILQTVDRRSNRNPYTYLSLGDLSMMHGNPEDAERYYRRALKLKRDDQDIQAAMGLWAVEAGDLKEARRRLEKAETLLEESEHVTVKGSRVQRLMQRLEEADSSQV